MSDPRVELGRVVLIGASGMLGRAWAELLVRENLEHRSLSRAELDLARPERVEAFDFSGSDVVINCAAWTDVDGAEEHEAEASVLNGHGVRALAVAVKRVGGLLVYYGTDYVFSGKADAPWPVDGELQPLNAYGRSKALGEVALRQSGCSHLMLRTSWLYAPWGKNFVRTMARLGAERSELKVVDDQRGRPTSAEHLAAATLALLRVGARGTLHVTDGGECSWFELARHVVSRINPACSVQPCTSAQFVRPAPRPSYSVLDLAPTEGLIGPMPPWQDNVDRVLERLEPPVTPDELTTR